MTEENLPAREILQAMFGAKYSEEEGLQELANRAALDFALLARRAPTRDDLLELGDLFHAVGRALEGMAGGTEGGSLRRPVRVGESPHG